MAPSFFPGSEPVPRDLAEALRASAPRRGAIGEPLWYFTELPSTNDAAALLAERGRMGRCWHSPPGAGLYVSVVFRDARLAPMLTLAGGVAAADGIRAATGLPVEIKWPNDIVVREGRARARRLKLAGILAEASTGAEGLQHVILGLGINVRDVPYPQELVGIATSLEAELGRTVETAPVLAETLAALNAQAQRLAAGDAASVLDRWRALAPLAVGAAVEWDQSSRPTRGTTAGIDADGALLVWAGGETSRIVSGEVRWL